MKRLLTTQNLLLPIILIVSVIITILFIPTVAISHNLTILLRQASYLGIIAMGLAFIILTGGIDLSIGAMTALSAGIGGYLYSHYELPVILVIFLSVLSVAFLGILNGVIISKLRIKPILATLGSLIVFSNVYLLINRQDSNFTLSYFMSNLYWGYAGGIPIPFVICLILLLLASFLLNFTYFGRYLYAIGDNPDALVMMGVNVKRYEILAYSLGGIFAGFAGILMLARTPHPSVSGLNISVLFDALIALRIGGISFNGAKGRILNAVLGSFLLILLSNFLTYIKIEIHMQSILKGIFFLVMVTFENGWKSRAATDTLAED